MTDTDHFEGTRAIGAQHAFNTTRLSEWLCANLSGFAGPLTAELFKGGQSNPTYKLQTPAKNYVMRTKPGPVAKLLPSAHAIEREYAVMRALFGSAVPVPAMLCICDDEDVIGRAFYVMEFKEGRVFWDQGLPGMTAVQRSAIYDEMNRVIAALHSVDYTALELASFGKPGNYFERQIARWSKQYVSSVTDPIPEMEKLIDWLPRNMPQSARDVALSSIVHGDYRLDNLMFDPSEPRALAVLDWELSTLGHPLADFSYHCMTWHISPGQFRGISGLDLKALGIPEEQNYIAAYCDRTGFATPSDLAQDWSFYLTYNMFRLAAILQGIAKRAEAGTASSERAAASGAGARPLAKLAWSMAQRA